MKYNAKAIRAARERKLMTRYELADKANVSYAAISAIEGGRAGLWIKALRRIATVLELTEEELFGSPRPLSPGPSAATKRRVG